MQRDPVGGEVLPPTLLAVDDDDGVGDNKPLGAERAHGLEHGCSAGDEVLDDEHGLSAAGAEGTLDTLGVVAAEQHGHGGGDGERGRERQRRVGHAAEEVVGARGGEGAEE